MKGGTPRTDRGKNRGTSRCHLNLDQFPPPLHETFKRRAIEGIREAVIRYQLEYPKSKEEEMPYNSGPNASDSTIAMDRTCINIMKHLFTITGKYTNLLMLVDNPPLHPPSMDDYDLALVLKYKDQKQKGEELKDHNGNTVNDITGRPVICVGGWKAQINAKKFDVVVSKIHQHFEQTGPYRRECSACFGLQAGCPQHIGDPRTRRKGDASKGNIYITLARIWRAAHKSLLKKQSANPVIGAIPLNPMQVLEIRGMLLYQKLTRLQFWVLMIISIKLFLRSDESTGNTKENTDNSTHSQGLTIDSIDLEASIFSRNVLEGLVVKVSAVNIG